MPLYIRDDEVARLAREVQAAGGARTVTEAVRRALETERDRLRHTMPAAQKLRKAWALTDAIGADLPDESAG